MELFKDSLLVLVAAPVVLALIVAEAVVGYLHDRHDYTVKGTLTNAYLAAVNVGLDVSMRAAWFAVMTWSFRFHVARVANPCAYWVALLVLQDLLFYFLHRVDHRCRLFWAMHVTHHSSDEFNLTVGFRPSVLQPLYRFAWFAPLTLLGFRPEDVMLMYSATQLYGVFVHTRAVGKLGPLEWVLCTPSHHRVHHGTNPQYLDKNLGTVFIVWDRLFGTFAEEKEEVRFGLAGRRPTCHPLRVIFHEWVALWRDLREPVPLKARLMYLFGPPGWRYTPRAAGPARPSEGAAAGRVPARSVA
jgi:sterol desaturase/sphingolipid hydroxylase (fatty acid hydroxylase superfamily)